ncbi:hypothetical protein CDD80_4520 [Ophiocordyceps camponoti-rufipedis]|uniref:C2H2-type domain-containing protein n=1 Tax=Ophiocordyceps camponoti-rufipedis TaxID=2004952 RepID=A0A2C5YUK0_9HYPO|nr:hypothetical protein CDD80_4520 [Ophiocordyceps camponoti-rufipedis]
MKRQRDTVDTCLDTPADHAPPDVTTEQPAKISELESPSDQTVVMKCSLPPHKLPLAFHSYDDYEAHYHASHTHRCLDCHKNLPSDHLLSIHIEEFHDPLVSIQREKGERTYSCFVEGCDKKCRTHQRRRMHLIDKHMYPKNYFFAVTKEGIDGRRSLLVDANRRRKPKASKSPVATEIPEGSRVPSQQYIQPAEVPTVPEVDMEQLSATMSSLQFIPSSVRFGRGGAGFSRK